MAGVPKERVVELANLAARTNLTSGLPHGFSFKGNQLFFLGALPFSTTSTLQYVTVPEAAAGGGQLPVLDPSTVIQPDALSSSHKFSKEELLLRERQRLSEFGITSFRLTPSSAQHDSILAPVADQLMVAEKKGDQYLVDFCHPSNGAMDTKWSADGRLVSFIRNSDIWVLDLQTKTEHQITSVHAQSPTKSAGESKFIIQEEFDRYTAYWWSPVIDANKKEYKILYLVEDEASVRKFFIPQPGYVGEVDEYRYPLAGEPNTTFEVWVATITLHSGAEGHSIAVNTANIFPKLAENFGWSEYIVRAGWFRAGTSVWVQLLDRLQGRTALVELSVDPSAAEPKIILEEHSNIWINVTDIIHVLEDRRIIWASERTGFRHLYLLTPSPQGPHTVTAITAVSEKGGHGEWGHEWSVVNDSRLHVDERSELVYFEATRDTPLESHLYVASFAQDAKATEIVRLTPVGLSHVVVMNEKCTTFVSSSSSITEPLQVTLYKLVRENSTTKFPTAVPLATISYPPKAYPIGLPQNVPKVFWFENKHGVKLSGAIYLPSDYDPSGTTKYRTLVRIYGGPHVQIVRNSHGLCRYLDIQMYTGLGFIVVMIDNAGSDRRGLNFESVLKHAMGTVEIADQVAGINHLIEKEHYHIDRSRIAITGWSYGGYLSLMALAQRPDVFKIAIPKCPVTLWEAYDTGYTERYMGTPESQPSAYRLSSVLSNVNSFPDEENRLLLVHGLQDENVHFSNTTQLIDALIASYKPYRLLVLPKERHGCSNPSTRVFLEVSSAWFLLQHL